MAPGHQFLLVSWLAFVHIAVAKRVSTVLSLQPDLQQDSIETVQRTTGADAQFLIQATFGPTRETLAELAGLSYEAWISRQMSLPAESHRSHYRARVNPRQATPMPVGMPRSRCAANSRWHRFAVELADRNARIQVRDGKVFVNNAFRTDIDPSFVSNGWARPAQCTNVAPNAWRNSRGVLTRNCSGTSPVRDWECSSDALIREGACAKSCFDLSRPIDDTDCSGGWVGFTYEGFVCDVVEAVGGLLRLSNTTDCKGPFTAMRNPAVWLARPPAGTVSPLKFRGLRPGVLLLAEAATGECALADIVQVQNCDGNSTCMPGQFLRHSERLELLENSPEKPLARSGSAATLCPTVRRNFLNGASCRLQQACAPMPTQRVRIALTAANLRRFYTSGGRYVYQVSGLVAQASPCRTISRWSLLPCTNATACPPTALTAVQLQPIQTALQALTGQFRDINPACDGVPAGAVVQVGGSFFAHVHLNEGNIYDFSEWVRRHPGGSAPIMRFAEQGEVVLKFPSWHEIARWMASTTQASLAFVGLPGATVEFTDLPAGLQTPAVADAFGASAPSTYHEVCGSPGEVANDPTQGHWLSFQQRLLNLDNKDYSFSDRIYEVPNPWSWQDSITSKVNVWLQKALYGKDQLRQRMAWALSQIFVHGNDDNRDYNEMKLAYYDIFVRNAFGNFRDVLREVTYSPAMGQYLTYLSNKAFHVQGTYPDENYAREIMQLFTIGLWKLNPDGTRQYAPTGEAIPTYDNQHIQNFARVFTGFRQENPRGNIEHAWGDGNWIDPMQMQTDWHDIYPKMDLDSNYLGDGYPLCSDLPRDAFLRRSARFEFAGYQPPSGEAAFAIVNLSSTASPLYSYLCYGQLLTKDQLRERATVACTIQTAVELPETISCIGEECVLDLPRFVKVGSGYYEYVKPRCTNLFFFNGRQLRRGWDTTVVDCANPDLAVAGTSCCGGQGEQYPTTCWAEGRRARFGTAEALCANENLNICGPPATSGQVGRCGFDFLNIWTRASCKVSVGIDATGKVSPQLDAQSKVAKFPVQWSSNGFPAVSNETCAAAGCVLAGVECICEVTVETRAPFSRLPAKEELALLKVGAFTPVVPCSVCNGTVRSYSASGAIDVGTVFEADGRFYRNVESIVRVGNGYSFRNPPAFMVRGQATRRDALNEVEALLDYLVTHPNTPVFTSYRLIQRFGNSNPSERYLQDVAEAFRSGSYGGRTYSGKYGDLAATIAAILLHPEARDASSPKAGALREPVLKIVHFLRSMEYTDKSKRQMVMRDLATMIGQTPMLAPSVFNFYRFNYQPAFFVQNEQLRSLVAPEYEIQDASKLVSFINGMVSMIDNSGLSDCSGGFGLPTAGTSLSKLTSNTNLCESGNLNFISRISNATSDAVINDLSILLTGQRLSPKSLAAVRDTYQANFEGPYNNTYLDLYAPEPFRFTVFSQAVAAAMNSSVAGGITQEKDGSFTLRVGTAPLASTNNEVSWIKKASPAAKIKAAQVAIMLTPEFNTVGGAQVSKPLPAPAPAPPAPVVQPRPYKAVVQLYLAGGADTFQLLVPQNCPLYDQYVAVRQSIAFTPAMLHQVSTSNQQCANFGIHNKLPFLAELYRAGDAAFMSNVGNLAEPLLSRQEFERSGKKRCIGVFSHEDQTQGAQTLFCQTRGASHMGAGGRIADALATGPLKFKTASFSLAGNQIWADGYQTKLSALSPDNGVERIRKIDGLRTVVGNITDQTYDGVYSDIAVRGLAESVKKSEEIGKILSAVQLKTAFPRNTNLQKQFNQVARIMASRAERGAERDFFFVSIGGFDTHTNVNQNLDRIFTEINDALKAFVDELKAQNVWSSTVLFTASDFARTLTPNDSGSDAGTDHAWAGNHLMMGGGVRGSRVYNDFPESLLEGSPMDLGRGRLIPKYPYESFMVPVATWLGVDEGQLPASFPNLQNFNRTAHIIAPEALFKA